MDLSPENRPQTWCCVLSEGDPLQMVNIGKQHQGGNLVGIFVMISWLHLSHGVVLSVGTKCDISLSPWSSQFVPSGLVLLKVLSDRAYRAPERKQNPSERPPGSWSKPSIQSAWCSLWLRRKQWVFSIKWNFWADIKCSRNKSLETFNWPTRHQPRL